MARGAWRVARGAWARGNGLTHARGPAEGARPRAVTDKFSFPQEEEKTLSFWRDIDAFQTSLKLSEGRPEYTFYDGPPFATGLPHYGHLLAGSIKVRACGVQLVRRAAVALSQCPRRRPRVWERERRAGHCDALRARTRLPRGAPLRMGLPRPAGRVRD